MAKETNHKNPALERMEKAQASQCYWYSCPRERSWAICVPLSGLCTHRPGLSCSLLSLACRIALHPVLIPDTSSASCPSKDWQVSSPHQTLPPLIHSPPTHLHISAGWALGFTPCKAFALVCTFCKKNKAEAWALGARPAWVPWGAHLPTGSWPCLAASFSWGWNCGEPGAIRAGWELYHLSRSTAKAILDNLVEIQVALKPPAWAQ